MAIHIEDQHFYLTRDNREVGPIRLEGEVAYVGNGLGNGYYVYTETGMIWPDEHDKTPLDLVKDLGLKFSFGPRVGVDMTVFANSSRTKIYLSGPMTGFPAHNYPLFNAAAAQLRAAGYDVYNPAEYRFEGEFPVRQAFTQFSRFICEMADAVVLLPGWHASQGAQAERALAESCGIYIVEFASFGLDTLGQLGPIISKQAAE